MYEHIRGKLVSAGDGQVVVDVGGIGYCLAVPQSTLQSVRGETHVLLHTVLRVRDEQMVLYGFATSEERQIFRRVCSVAGVGPGIALAILSGIPIDEFREAVRGEQPRVLQRIRGVGKKTAERLVLELKEVLAPATGTTPGGIGGAAACEGDAVAALIAIGFPAHHAERSVAQVCRELPDNPSIEDVVKAATRVARAGG